MIVSVDVVSSVPSRLTTKADANAGFIDFVQSQFPYLVLGHTSYGHKAMLISGQPVLMLHFE